MKWMIIVFIFLIVIVSAYFLFFKKTEAPLTDSTSSLQVGSGQAPVQEFKTVLENNLYTVNLKTNFGEIQFTTYDADAPKTVKNFIELANKDFYNSLTFHRIIKGFMIQGGDPNGDGTGGPGYKFEDEFNLNTESYKQGYKRGVVAMANAGPNTNGSQFFIMHEDYDLPNNYTIFGKVINGQEVVDKIASVATNPENNKPIEPVVIEKITITKNF